MCRVYVVFVCLSIAWLTIACMFEALLGGEKETRVRGGVRVTAVISNSGRVILAGGPEQKGHVHSIEQCIKEVRRCQDTVVSREIWQAGEFWRCASCGIDGRSIRVKCGAG
jgi:hypothetical protein